MADSRHGQVSLASGRARAAIGGPSALERSHFVGPVLIATARFPKPSAAVVGNLRKLARAGRSRWPRVPQGRSYYNLIVPRMVE
jgi:hypothetical protein